MVWHPGCNFRDEPPGLLEILDSRGRGVLNLLEALLLCCCEIIPNLDPRKLYVGKFKSMLMYIHANP